MSSESCNGVSVDDRLKRLLAELKTIRVWDEEYCRKNSHEEADELAYRARQERRQEIMREIEKLAAQSRESN